MGKFCFVCNSDIVLGNSELTGHFPIYLNGNVIDYIVQFEPEAEGSRPTSTTVLSVINSPLIPLLAKTCQHSYRLTLLLHSYLQGSNFFCFEHKKAYKTT